MAKSKHTSKSKSAAAKRPARTSSSNGSFSPALLRAVRAQTRSREFQKYIRDLLIEICEIDTTPKPNPAEMRAAEAKCFAILERELQALGFAGARMEKHPVNPTIKNHPHYSLLHFTKTAARPEGLTPEETYEGRSNLLYIVPGRNGGAGGKSLAVNAHIDVVPPYFPPRLKGNIVFGRGSCDDKGPVVGIVGALKALKEVLPADGWNRNLVIMFVVEEETGGNGSLSLAMDRKLKDLYDSICVCECTGLKIYPANRGAVWYRAALRAPESVSPLELAAFVLEEIEKEGAAIRTESRHALFPQRPVQTCHGIIGPFGEHPSRICGLVSFSIQLGAPPDAKVTALLEDCLNSGLTDYIGRYGDKSKVIDPATGKVMVAKHFALTREKNGVRVDVHGATGHMGAIRERDGAITKMSHLVRSLVFSRARLEKASGGRMRLELAGGEKNPLVLEGGQGFVPTHDINEVMERLRQAAARGAGHYLQRLGRNEFGADVTKITYEKLHNVAFDGDPDSPTMRNALTAAKATGLQQDDPILGWTVSCDSRLFATEYPGMPVITFGPGKLAFAHSDQEQVDLEEVRAAAECLALFMVQQTGSNPR